MNLQDELKLRTENTSLRQIAEIMGYSERQATKAANRIHSVITSDNLGLDAGGYDFKYSNLEFALKLSKVVGLDAHECFDQIEKLNTQLFEYRIAYKPWIFIDTGFHRTTEPIHALAFMENRRRLPVSKEISSLPMEQQIEHIRQIIQNHHTNSGGKLDMWGEIICYKYIYADRTSIIFDTGGHVVDTGEGPVQPAAKITINGQDLTKIIKVAGKSQ